MDWDNVVLAVIAVATALNSYFQWRSNQISHETKAIAKKTQADVALVEKATNSMKDALVRATADASLAQGLAAGRAEMVAERKAEEGKT